MNALSGMTTRFASERGQAATEYMALVSVVVIAVVAAAWTFVPGFQDGVGALATDVSTILDTGAIGGVGLPRDGAAGAPAAPATPGGSRAFRIEGSLGHHNGIDDDVPAPLRRERDQNT